MNAWRLVPPEPVGVQLHTMHMQLSVGLRGVRRRRRPGQVWSCRQARRAGHQPDRRQFFERRGNDETAGAPAPAGTRRDSCGCAGQPEQWGCPAAADRIGSMCASSARSRQALGFRVSASCRNPVIRPDFSARWRRQVAISLAPTRAIISSIDLSLSDVCCHGRRQFPRSLDFHNGAVPIWLAPVPRGSFTAVHKPQFGT
jgi:hypothetical protein